MNSEWNYCYLTDVCKDITAGGAAPQGPKYFENGKYPFVRVVDMGNLHGTKNMTKTRDLLNDDGIAGLRLFPKGTVLFTKSGASLLLNQRALLKEPMYVVSHIGCLVPNETVLSEWLYYWMKTVDFNIFAHATTLPSLKLTTIKTLKLPLPPLVEQERIVNRIEEMFSQLDAGVETLKKTKAQLAVYRQAVLKESFAKVTTSVPLGNISESRLGKMLDREKNTGIPRRYLRNINVRWFSFDLDDLLEMRIEDDEIEKFTVLKGDLVVCEGGEPGRCAVWEYDESFFYQKALHRVRFTDNSNPKFYMYYLWYAAQTGQLKPYFTGTGIKHLTGQSLVKVPVPTAKTDIQNGIVYNIESRLSVCDSIEHTVDIALQQAEAMRQSILKNAFEGRL